MKKIKLFGVAWLLSAFILSVSGASAATESSASTQSSGDPIPDIDITLKRDDVGDSDGDGYGDSIREGGQTVDAGTVPETQSQVLDQGTSAANTGIEPDEIDYDGSQETNFGVLLDSGSEGGEDSEERKGKVETGWKVEEGESAANTGIEPDEIDVSITDETIASVDVFIKIPPIEGDTGERVVKLEGLQIDHLDDDSDDDGLEADHEAEITLKSLRASIRVNAAEVRGWDPETKEAVRTRLAANDAKNDANDHGMFVALQALDHENITDISVDDAGVTVAYTTTLAVFGFIPVQVSAEARLTSEGEVETNYPWWGFLARRTQSDSTYVDVASDIRARIAIEEEGVPAVDESKATS